jgi:hypothetical protein
MCIELRRMGDKELRQVCRMMWQMMWISCICREFILMSINYIVIWD